MSHIRVLVLVLLVACGVTLQVSGAIDVFRLIAAARAYTEHWWLVPCLVLIQAVLFTFAMAGSLLVWVAAALYPPPAATLIIAAGTTLGGLSAYLFSVRLSREWTRKVAGSRIYRLLSREGGFLTLLALRLMPGFPHSVINYSSGILRLRLIGFLTATAIGTAAKTYVYARLIYSASSPDSMARSIALADVWPLMALSLLILAAIIVKRHLR